MRSSISKEIGIIEELMKEDNRWAANLEDASVYKALERQRKNLLQVDEVIWMQ